MFQKELVFNYATQWKIYPIALSLEKKVSVKCKFLQYGPGLGLINKNSQI
jgi:hypothetical protein